jgi:hypothetical protein
MGEVSEASPLDALHQCYDILITLCSIVGGEEASGTSAATGGGRDASIHALQGMCLEGQEVIKCFSGNTTISG